MHSIPLILAPRHCHSDQSSSPGQRVTWVCVSCSGPSSSCSQAPSRVELKGKHIHLPRAAAKLPLPLPSNTQSEFTTCALRCLCPHLGSYNTTTIFTAGCSTPALKHGERPPELASPKTFSSPQSETQTLNQKLKLHATPPQTAQPSKLTCLLGEFLGSSRGTAGREGADPAQGQPHISNI